MALVEAGREFADLERIQGERRDAATYISEYETRYSFWRDWHDRTTDLDKFLSGDWSVVFPDDSVVTERPRIPNIGQLALNDYSALAASIRPSIYCESPDVESEGRYDKLTAINNNYLQVNRYYPRLAIRFFMDLIGYGASFKLVEPNFRTGFPRIRRLNPHYVYLDRLYTPDDEPSNMLVAYEQSRSVLASRYPEYAGEIVDRGNANELVKIIEYYDASEWIRVAEVARSKGKGHGIVLDRTASLLDCPPVVIQSWLSHDDQFRGLFDQVLGPSHHANRIATLLVDLAAEMVGSPIIENDIANPEDIGSGVVLHAKNKDAWLRRAELASANPQAFAILQQQMDGAWTQASYPKARQGIAEQSIISAAGLNSLVGNLSTFVALMQHLDADSNERVLALCAEIDEKYLAFQAGPDGEQVPWRKAIKGVASGEKYNLTYQPATTIRGMYQTAEVDYPIAGVDQFGFDIRLYQALGNGVISERRAKRLSSLVGGNMRKIEDEIEREAILKAARAFIQAKAADPNNPDFGPASAFIEALGEDEQTRLTILQRFGELFAPTPAAAPQDAFTQAAAATRGGVAAPAGPGGAPAAATNVPGVAAGAGIGGGDTYMPPYAELTRRR